MDSIFSFLKYIFRYKKKTVDQIVFYVSLISAATMVVHVGYITDPEVAKLTDNAVVALYYGLFLFEIIRTASSILVARRINVSHYTGVMVSAYFLLITISRLTGGILSTFAKDEWLYLGIAIIFLSELSKNSLFFDNFYFNPTILFVISFLGLIILGAFLLMLPRTTLEAPLSFVDAFFMATSAVCITGLSTTDISTNFSLFGQSVIMALIQVGGLGIMTFTGFFGYFFSGGFSFKNQLMFGEILGENKLNSVISTLLTIIFITLLFELIGAVMIFASLEAKYFDSVGEMIFFSCFHAISGFCNAGFTIIKDGVTSDEYRFNYNFQLAVASMFILGGFGFGTIFNLYTWVQEKVKSMVRRLILKKNYRYKPQVFSFNSRFIVVCNVTVIILATISFFVLEQNHSLMADKSSFGRWVTSIFMANSTRSAGFNSVDLNFINIPTLIMFVTLMWIGVSPGSTGGGVKVTTIAIALMNIVALAKGKESIEIYKRKIASESVNKAFAIILLSVLTITLSFILLNFSDPNQQMIPLLFESVSAYTTCGLSLGITSSLTATSKIILMFTMFVGRVGMLTLLVAFIKNTRNKSYIYPTEKVLF
ncbi:potassium transporter [Sphingobacterium mizutaii NBRC 14946 = DSM 11724]|uniref:Ktr system potassium uptake protein B n=2 Tax=Sphingobacterium mizutaii TaxID=1010 RepID=A0AAJ4XFQ1_9SPHI|nr:potassium transporter TrkG [Sphingobacterium mizutaii]GEM66419.1 potassium transporter [Sphingobacterium mizutaii NBRC 14946 = DSM 11724]SDL54950.1 Trk-type K+ transport system, membrane component [Sphingobacterium mizutaii]SNV63878.1 Ktr system potassium uptake protein B [Sphingobacterium mizutaii]